MSLAHTTSSIWVLPLSSYNIPPDFLVLITISHPNLFQLLVYTLTFDPSTTPNPSHRSLSYAVPGVSQSTRRFKLPSSHPGPASSDIDNVTGGFGEVAEMDNSVLGVRLVSVAAPANTLSPCPNLCPPTPFSTLIITAEAALTPASFYYNTPGFTNVDLRVTNLIKGPLSTTHSLHSPLNQLVDSGGPRSVDPLVPPLPTSMISPTPLTLPYLLGSGPGGRGLSRGEPGSECGNEPRTLNGYLDVMFHS
ncbi:hypothetical protein GYMLUDRAFT_246152 [Collybiopsis luxurians FD-317 M1]|uniref:Unplaced genomic scaffold GYMLUscaffold_37, whole genome shotgun sequence n=1 Tax=Collybiopsis luxurians FD-317 M1 TaxID=944289 RepID=A0A0D0BSY8_9AGAR|nr:hypothetical protein GYMLUDRAFT_246152 [Collybiopsis luxurians FD-317 M1]